MLLQDFIVQLATAIHNMKDLLSDRVKKIPSETYIEFLTSALGASKEEVLEVIKRSGISTRRIAEFLVNRKNLSEQILDDE